MRYTKYIFLFSLWLGLSLPSCDLDLQQDPNELSPDQADINFLLNGLQFGYQELFFDVNEPSMMLSRMTAWGSDLGVGAVTYRQVWQPATFDDIWEGAYAGVLPDADNIIARASDRSLFVHAGIAKVIKAMTLMNLVDIFGDIPYTEALDADILNPSLDEGASVYAEAERILTEAIEDFGKTSVGSPAIDLFYGGDVDAWVKAANSMLLRAYITTRLVDQSVASKINAVAPNCITDNEDNFNFNYSSDGTTAPVSRHPDFQKNYADASAYQSNSYMARFLNERDPRLRYYFYRQVAEFTSDPNEAECILEDKPAHFGEEDVYCNPGSGYWGRDHLNNDGIPPDNLLRTQFGVYPAGGKFDADEAVNTSLSDGLIGAGIMPFMHASWVKFMLAEAALTLGTDGDPRTLLEEGVRQSISYVMDFGASVANPDFIPSDDDVEQYVTGVLEAYDAADDAGKLNVVATEYYKALFGNGLEAYNMYRRTGLPNDLPPSLIPNPGAFARSLWYPQRPVTLNRNVSQKSDVDVPVFWDNNPAGFID